RRPSWRRWAPIARRRFARTASEWTSSPKARKWCRWSWPSRSGPAAYWRRKEHERFIESLPARADAVHARLADAAGGPLHEGLPRAPAEKIVPRALQRPFSGRRGDGRSAEKTGHRRGDPFFGHPADPGADGPRTVLSGRRARDREP